MSHYFSNRIKHQLINLTFNYIVMQVLIFLTKNGFKKQVNILGLSTQSTIFQVLIIVMQVNTQFMHSIQSRKSKYLESSNLKQDKSMMIIKSKISSLKLTNSTKKNFINLSPILSIKINSVKNFITNLISYHQLKLSNDLSYLFFFHFHFLSFNLSIEDFFNKIPKN